MHPYVLLLLSIAAGWSCQRANRPVNQELPTFDREPAELVLQVVSRGVYEYLIVVAEHEYMPREISEELQARCRERQGRLPVLISGQVQPEKTWVHRPGPTDAPERDREVHWIELSLIEVR